MRTLLCGRRGLITATATLFVTAALPASAAPDDHAVIAPIQNLVDALLRIMKAGPGTSFRQRFGMLAPTIDQTFDLDAILRASVGLSWDALPPDQKTMLTQAFRRYTIVSYVNSFDEFNGQQFEVSPTTRPIGNEQVVQTRIIQRSGGSNELDYVMRKDGSVWRAVDVLADGTISRVAVQRSDFRRLLMHGGAGALAQNLRSKSTDLSDGES